MRNPEKTAMGYSTYFEGSFKLDAPLTDEQVDSINKLREDHTSEPGAPERWCGWEATDDTTIEHDGEEKFYDYVEWLQFIIDSRLRKWGRLLNGSVMWDGEDARDVGRITVTNNVVEAVPCTPMSSSLLAALDENAKMLEACPFTSPSAILVANNLRELIAREDNNRA